MGMMMLAEVPCSLGASWDQNELLEKAATTLDGPVRVLQIGWRSLQVLDLWKVQDGFCILKIQEGTA